MITSKDIAIVVILYNDTPLNYVFSIEYTVILVDNTSNRDLNRTVRFPPNVIYMPLKENKGIAYALNKGVSKAIEKGVKWVLTMDQDSNLPVDMVDIYMRFANSIETTAIGIISPRISYYKGHTVMPKNSYDEIGECITSGSFINVEAYKRVGGFKDFLFIDYVDFEYCYNLRRNGFRLLRINNIVLPHYLGNTKDYKVFGKHLLYATNHSYIRHYYMARNWQYIKNEYKDYIYKERFPMLRSIFGNLRLLIFESDSLRKIRARRLGLMDYSKGIYGKYNHLL